MTHTTGATFCAWAILSSLLGAFLVFHLWNFDRFKCLRWNNGPYSGAFKRIMTYTYLITIPIIMVYAIGFSVIKYDVGYSFVLGYGIIPTPWQFWPQSYKSAILPLYLLFSIGWSFEMVTHLEELCFWLFLVNSGSVQQDWFRSMYFKTWIVGSCVAVIYMPLVTIFTRQDPLRCEAFTFLAGSLGSLSLTLWFTPVLWAFPNFINSLRKEGVDISTVVRLTKFHELNSVRVAFRFLFVVPLLILGVDGVRPHQHVNTSSFGTEFLAIIAGIGCVVSSGITLVIFFPRNIESEIAAKNASRGHQLTTFRSTQHTDMNMSYYSSPHSQEVKPPVSIISDYRGNDAMSMEYLAEGDSPALLRSTIPDIENVTTSVPTSIKFAPNRRLPTGGTAQGAVVVSGLTEQNLARHDHRQSGVHPYITNFTSPIDVMDRDVRSRVLRTAYARAQGGPQ